MSRPEVLTVAVTLMVPLVTAIVGALGIVFQDWRARRGSAARRRLAIEEATRQVTFVSDWWKANQLIIDDADALTEARARAAMLVADASSLVASVPTATSKLRPRAVTRRLLLLYPFTICGSPSRWA
jgi:hypothetical protein